MPSRRTFYKRVITIEVLSEEPYEVEDLADIAHDIVHGHQSGAWSLGEHQEMSGPEMAKALVDQGSAPEFFRLDEHGNDLECHKCGSDLENAEGGCPTADSAWCSDETCPHHDWPQDVDFDGDGNCLKPEDRTRRRPDGSCTEPTHGHNNQPKEG